MIDYFKYTNGDSFTLSGVDYSGLFNIQEGKAYTGKSFSTSSKLLSGKDTFLTNCFLNKFEFDRTVSIENTNTLKQPKISPRNIIDQNFIDTNLQILNMNNLIIYSKNIIANPDLFDFLNSIENEDSYFLGLSSGKNDIRNDDTKLAKTNKFPIQIDPFSFIDKVPGMEVLDDTVDSMVFIYDDKSFNYFTTTSTSSYTFSGTFATGGSLVRLEEDVFEGAQRFSYDNNTDTLYALEKSLNNAGQERFVLKLYDNSFVSQCRVLKLVDQISLEDNVIDDKVSLGNNILGYRYTERLDVQTDEDGNLINSRTHGANRLQQQNLNNLQQPKIKIVNKYTFELINNVVTSNPSEEILEFDIRDSDDSLLILTSLDGFDAEEFFIYHLDIDKVSSVEGDYVLPFNPKVLKRFKPEVVFNQRKDTVTIYFSSNDSNIFIIDDEGAISSRFISNPENVAGFPSNKNLLYLEDMFFESTLERFDKIQKKFNSNTLPSNNYNNLNFLVGKNNTNLYYLLHNIGRIYLMEESKILYKNFVPLDLENLYEQIISCESGLGISINSELQNIIKDTVNVFLNASVIPFKEVREGIPILGKLVSYEGVDIDFRNLEFHDNEEVNYDTVSRVFDQIYKLQETIFNIIVSQDDNEDEVNVIEVDQTDEIIINQYTRGGEFILTDTGEDYVGFYHVHPDKGYMVGPLHIDSPHAYLTPIVNVNVTPVEVVESVPDVIESPQPRYSSHGMTSNDSRNRRQNTSGGNSSSGSSGGSY
tara:strand:+ start:6572 stop:8848 length:2277 start_codon:yes stop_codon:yes gene_type:complete